MKPINYTFENNVAKFIYDKQEYEDFHAYGKEHGNNGGILVEKDYNTLFSKYEWYGTIESPCKSLNYVSIECDPTYDGNFGSPEETMESFYKKYEPLYETYRFDIINLGGDETN